LVLLDDLAGLQEAVSEDVVTLASAQALDEDDRGNQRGLDTPLDSPITNRYTTYR
jgi:hypothetical protein